MHISRVKEHEPLQTGHKTQYWCCQDQNQKQKARPSQMEGVKHQDMLGMHWYNCKSQLNIPYCTNPGSNEKTYKITIWLEHHMKHPPYYDVSIPPGAMALIWENLRWFSPHEVAKKVLQIYPTITATQVHTDWKLMSETLWKRSRDQLPSVRLLLEELQSNVAILDLPGMDGVDQVMWVMKSILGLLQGKIVEIGMDTTCERLSEHQTASTNNKYIDNTDSHHLELYTILREYNNTGFPLSYCLLTTAMSIKEKTENVQKHYQHGQPSCAMNMASSQDLSTLTKTWWKLVPVIKYGLRWNINSVGGINARHFLDDALKEVYLPHLSWPRYMNRLLFLLSHLSYLPFVLFYHYLVLNAD